MDLLPFHPADPPARPPSACEDDLMWTMAYHLHRDHRLSNDGSCTTCPTGQFRPCLGRYLAMRGFLASCNLPDLMFLGEKR